MNEERKPVRPVAAFVVSLIAGLWMLAAGGMMGWGYMGGYGWGGHMGENYGDWMWKHHQMMHGYGGDAWWSWVGFACGIVVLVGAVALYSKPATARSWGVAIMVASVVDLFAGSGGLLAGALGIIGGVLAFTWNPWTERK
jgi:hypothetical protein